MLCYLFCDPKCYSHPETKPYTRFLCNLLHVMSIPGYCIPRGITMQKVSISPYFYPQNSQKLAETSVLQPTTQNIQISNFCIIKTTNAIPTKFCTVIKTIKFWLWVVPKFAPQIQNGRQTPSLKNDELLYLSNGSTDFYEVLHADAYCSPNPKRCLKIQDDERPPFWKMLNAICPQSFWLIFMKLGKVMHILCLPLWQVTKNLKIWKFTMADNGHLENRKIAISPNLFGQFCWNFVW